MIQTTKLALEKYELNDAANLADGYNNSMDKIDSFASGIENKVDNNHEYIESKFPINSTDLANNSITSDKITNGAIVTDKIATAAITEDKIGTYSISGNKIKDGAISINKINQNYIDTTPENSSNNLITSDGVFGFVKNSIDSLGEASTYEVANTINQTAQINSLVTVDAIRKALSGNLYIAKHALEYEGETHHGDNALTIIATPFGFRASGYLSVFVNESVWSERHIFGQDLLVSPLEISPELKAILAQGNRTEPVEFGSIGFISIIRSQSNGGYSLSDYSLLNSFIEPDGSLYIHVFRSTLTLLQNYARGILGELSGHETVEFKACYFGMAYDGKYLL